MKYKKLIQRLLNLKYCEDKEDRHPENNVLEHSIQAFNIAKKETEYGSILPITALFHDIGKSIETLGHDKHSVDILKSFGYYNDDVFWLIKNHIRVIWFLNGEMSKLSKIKELMYDRIMFANLCHLKRIDNCARVKNKISKIDANEVNNILEITNYNR